jgi:prepilin-type N-terminal cleavage/methylation domain-containing protein
MKKKGFTLTEIMVVIAIFGILITVITPAWMSFLNRSKFRTYNQRAKTIFNAAQIVVTEMEFTERQYISRLTSDGVTATEKATLYGNIATPGSGAVRGEWYFYYNGKTGCVCDASGNSIVSSDNTITEGGSYQSTQADAVLDWQDKLESGITRIAGKDAVFKIWVDGYIVKSVACAEKPNSRFIGAHPVTIYDLDAKNVDTDDLKHTNVKDVDLGEFAT